MPTKVLEYPVYEKQVRSGDPDAKERGIRDVQGPGDSGDWRDPDVVIKLNDFVVQSKDDEFRAHHGGVMPDWDKGWAVVDNANNARPVFEGKGEPPAWVAQALKDGLVITGVIILRDQQRHNG